MRKYITLIAFVTASVFLQAQNWELVWSDEFQYSGLPDDSKWTFETEGNNWDWGNQEAQNYTPPENNNAWVDGENLVIEARKEKYYWAGDGETTDYTSARLVTAGKGDWLYGKIEVKALLPTGTGVWPAIWMLSTDWEYGNWPASGELDIMENVGYDQTTLHCNIHTEAYNHSIGTNKGNSVTITEPSTNWHVYWIEWNAENVSFYCDEQLVFSFDNEHNTYKEWPFDKRFHLLLNIAVGGSWGGANGIDDNIFSQQMKIDYVRVYQQAQQEQAPYNGTAQAIPGTLEMEEYDLGGNGFAYYDVSAGNEAGEFRSDDVDIEASLNGGYNLAFIREGEWLEYTVDVEEAGTYDISFNVASLLSKGAFHLEKDGSDLTGAVDISASNSTGWQDWKTVTVKEVALEAGEQVIRFVYDAGEFNIDKMVFEKSGGTVVTDRLPYLITNSSDFPDSKVFVAVVGIQDGKHVWLDAADNSIKPIDEVYNTVLGPTYGGNTGPGANSMYADCFTPLSEIPDMSLQIPKIAGCRILIAFEEQLYLYFFGNNGGYAAPDLANATDPNQGIRFELIELTWNEYGLWTNTSRVDSYQYPMGLEVWGGDGFYKQVGEKLKHEQILALWGNSVSESFEACYDSEMGVIHAPSKTAAFKEGGVQESYFDAYIDQIWAKYSAEDLIMFTGDAGTWSGRVKEDGRFEFYNQTNPFGNRTAIISAKPTTQEALEGKGVLAENVQQLPEQTLDLVVQAQFCAAINRHAINLNAAEGTTQDWSDASYYFTENPHNEYVRFWHMPEVSVSGASYGFCYDDVFDQSSTIHTPDPQKVEITVGGFPGQSISQSIDLKEGWNLVSFYLTPADQDVAHIFPNATIVKNDEVFYDSSQPNFLNSLQNVAAGAGYFVYNSSDETITVQGIESPSNTQLKQGWNLVGVNSPIALKCADLPVEAEAVKDLEYFYEPGNINSTITEMMPGKAYFVRSSSESQIKW